jgi:hypothetical protein
MFSKFSADERELMTKLYAMLCSHQDASTEFLDRVGSGLGSKTEIELREHYSRCFTDFLTRMDRKKGGLIS